MVCTVAVGEPTDFSRRTTKEQKKFLKNEGTGMWNRLVKALKGLELLQLDGVPGTLQDSKKKSGGMCCGGGRKGTEASTKNRKMVGIGEE